MRPALLLAFALTTASGPAAQEHYRLGLARERAGDLPGAEREYAAALMAAPRLAAARDHLAPVPGTAIRRLSQPPARPLGPPSTRRNPPARAAKLVRVWPLLRSRGAALRDFAAERQ